MNHKSYSHIGKKKVNEDYLKITHNALMVCDGVGGEVRGERASKEVAEYIIENLDLDSVDTPHLEELICNSHKHLNSIIENEPELDGMATTLAAVFLTTEGLYTAHIGDSRIYLIRPNEKKFWQTWDHSLVGTLVKNKEITREQARSHPMNNQINRAVKANAKGKLSKPELHLINDLRKDDIIFICSDGISEAFSDEELLNLLCNSDLNLKEKLDAIEKKCSADSFDNNTAIIAQIGKKDLPTGTIVPVEWITIQSLRDEEEIDSVEIQEDSETPKKKKGWFRFFKF